MNKKKLQMLKKEPENPEESEINLENSKTTTNLMMVVQQLIIKFKAGDQDSMILMVINEAVLDKEGVEILRLTVQEI